MSNFVFNCMCHNLCVKFCVSNCMYLNFFLILCVQLYVPNFICLILPCRNTTMMLCKPKIVRKNVKKTNLFNVLKRFTLHCNIIQKYPLIVYPNKFNFISFLNSIIMCYFLYDITFCAMKFPNCVLTVSWTYILSNLLIRKLKPKERATSCDIYL